VNLGKDYVQFVENIGQDNREQALSDITRRLKNLALTSKVAVFTASQLNDDGKLRESRAIGQHADCALLIDGQFIKVAKNRRGPRNVSVPVNLRGEISRFAYDDTRAAGCQRRNF
jgi:replicative DNA helicase